VTTSKKERFKGNL